MHQRWLEVKEVKGRQQLRLRLPQEVEDYLLNKAVVNAEHPRMALSVFQEVQCSVGCYGDGVFSGAVSSVGKVTILMRQTREC